jgi:quercetin dioxygenase-like cupin family protein
VQYVEYGPGHTDPMHQHKQDEFFIITAGSIWLDDVESGVGSVVFIPRSTEYAVRAGNEGARYFRVVVS